MIAKVRKNEVTAKEKHFFFGGFFFLWLFAPCIAMHLHFYLPIGDHEKIEALDDVHLIGHITHQKFGHILVTRDNQEFELKAQGWNPL